MRGKGTALMIRISNPSRDQNPQTRQKYKTHRAATIVFVLLCVFRLITIFEFKNDNGHTSHQQNITRPSSISSISRVHIKPVVLSVLF
jgi:hypothetical protein